MEEEKSSELERTQQQITLNLQEIDENFAKCNHIVASKIMPELERFAEATEQMWDSTKIWLDFFKLAGRAIDQNTTSNTNRPPFSPQERLAARAYWPSLRKNSILDNIYETPSTRESFRAGPHVPQSVGSVRREHTKEKIDKKTDKNHNNMESNASTPNSVNSQGALLDEYGNQIASPPRTTAFTPSREKTPLRKAMHVFVEHEIKKIEDNMSESSEEEPKRLSRIEEDYADVFSTSQDDSLRYQNFFSGREIRLKKMKRNEELPRLRRLVQSPSNRMSRNYRSWPSDLVSTPTINRVLSSKGDDLRHVQSQNNESASEDTSS
ncbi:DASH complex subunit Ask1-domain-containing protein [Sporodiniella umbellata]|nr:DASH complex subunit Ask1-domain-containing protein [Sporodiniella umbellata]